MAEVRRLWQDVMAVFWFMDPSCRFYLLQAAYNWWLKLDTQRRGGSEDYLRCTERDIEKYLSLAVERFAKGRQRWYRWLRKELGVDVQEGTRAVRAAVEGRLRTFQRAIAPRVGFTVGPTVGPQVAPEAGPSKRLGTGGPPLDAKFVNEPKALNF